MYSEELEMLMDAALVDGELSGKKRMILLKRAQEEGIDLDEFEMVLDARLAKLKKANQANVETAASQSNKVGDMKKCPACGAIHVAGTAVCPECGYAFTGIGPTRSAERLYEALQEFNRTNSLKANEHDGNGEQRFDNIKSALATSFGSMFNMGMGAKKDNRTAEEDVALRKFDIIQNFPVPNNREDLIDFLTAIQPKADLNAPKTGTEKNRRFDGSRGVAYSYTENLGYAYWLLYSNCINKARISFANDPDFTPFFSYFDSKNQTEPQKKGLFGRR